MTLLSTQWWWLGTAMSDFQSVAKFQNPNISARAPGTGDRGPFEAIVLGFNGFSVT